MVRLGPCCHSSFTRVCWYIDIVYNGPAVSMLSFIIHSCLLVYRHCVQWYGRVHAVVHHSLTTAAASQICSSSATWATVLAAVSRQTQHRSSSSYASWNWRAHLVSSRWYVCHGVNTATDFVSIITVCVVAFRFWTFRGITALVCTVAAFV